MPRILVPDILSLAVSLGGIILLLFSNTGLNGYASVSEPQNRRATDDDEGSFGQHNMMIAAMWSLVAIV